MKNGQTYSKKSRIMMKNGQTYSKNFSPLYMKGLTSKFINQVITVTFNVRKTYCVAFSF